MPPAPCSVSLPRKHPKPARLPTHLASRRRASPLALVVETQAAAAAAVLPAVYGAVLQDCRHNKKHRLRRSFPRDSTVKVDRSNPVPRNSDGSPRFPRWEQLQQLLLLRHRSMHSTPSRLWRRVNTNSRPFPPRRQTPKKLRIVGCIM